MVSDWLKTQKRPPRTNQIRAVLTTKFKKMAIVFIRRFNFVLKTTIEKLKNIPKTRTTAVESTFLWLNVLKMRC